MLKTYAHDDMVILEHFFIFLLPKRYFTKKIFEFFQINFNSKYKLNLNNEPQSPFYFSAWLQKRIQKNLFCTCLRSSCSGGITSFGKCSY